MRTTQIVVRAGLTAAALALPLALAAEPASATGASIRAATPACSEGGASLSGGQAALSQGLQRALDTSGATWSRTGPHAGCAAAVRVANNVTLPPVTTTPPPTTRPPTTPPVTVTPTTTASPARGVQGGVGGGSTDYGPLTMAVGGTLVAAAVGGGAWYVYRRRTHNRA